MLSTTLKKRDKVQFEQGLEQGLEKGFEKGIQKGIKKGKLETAKNLLKEKMPLTKIAEITGLTVDEIDKLKD